MSELTKLAATVLAMRQKQREYFSLAGAVKKDPTLHPKRRAVLEESKRLEKAVDELVAIALSPKQETLFGK